ncbi:MAG: hypothetical protein U0T80_03600 [Flavobacteriaceae bacterium]
MTVVKHRMIDKSYEIYLAMYQDWLVLMVTNTYKQFFSFFDLIILMSVTEVVPRKIVLGKYPTYFWKSYPCWFKQQHLKKPKKRVIEYFGEPVYTYSLKQELTMAF